MNNLIESLYNDLSVILLNNSMDETLYNILDFLISLFSYFSYVVIIILIFSIIKDMLIFTFKGGKK